METPGWEGVETELSRVVHSNLLGTASYMVEFHPWTGGDEQIVPEDSALYIVVRSTGIWQSADDEAAVVERHVEVVVKLKPRLTGRTIHPGDSATADDLVANPGNYDEIQRYALFAGKGNPSLVLDPGDRIDGKIWLDGDLQLYHDPLWASYVRDEFLDSIRRTMQRDDGQVVIRHPHPLAGDLTFRCRPSSSVRKDLERLGLGESWTETNTRPDRPEIDFSDWRTYRLYEGGFEYKAREINWQLRNETFRPTPDNPLGIFYRNGSVQVDDDVTIQGTLVAAGTVSIRGERVHVAGFNWLSDGGRPIVSGVDRWPRLPAIVAKEVSIDRSIQASVHGAIVVESSLKGAGGDFEYVDAQDVNITGTATAQPIRQPWSTVQLAEEPDLSQLNDRGEYAVWLADGTTGGWYAIVGVDEKRHQLTVLGEVRHDASTAFQIQRNRRRYIDIRGPVTGERHDINRPLAWATPTVSQWNDLHNAWKQENKDRTDAGQEPIEFVDWLARPANFSGWSYPIGQYGLNLAHVTFHLRNTEGITYRWSPPLFQAYEGTNEDAEFAGYRWEIVSWREMP